MVRTSVVRAVSDLLNEEPGLCCADVTDHDMQSYTQRLRGGCLSACERLVDCSCRRDEPKPASAPLAAPSPAADDSFGAPSPAGSADLVQPSSTQGTSDVLEPIQEPPRNPGET